MSNDSFAGNFGLCCWQDEVCRGRLPCPNVEYMGVPVGKVAPDNRSYGFEVWNLDSIKSRPCPLHHNKLVV